MPSVIIKPAGNAAPRVDKRAAESIVYLLDCRELLEPNEIINGTKLYSEQQGIAITDIRSRQGTMIEVRVDNSPLASTSQYTDFTVTVEFTTIFKNKKLAVFQVRTHK